MPLDSTTQAYLNAGGTLSNGAIPTGFGVVNGKVGPLQQAKDLNTTTLPQDQTKATNQGKPGYDVLGNPVASKAIIPTVISGDMSETNAQNTQKLSQGIQNNPATNGTSTETNSIQSLRESGGTYAGQDGNLYYNYDSTPTTGQGSMIPGTTLQSTGDVGVDNTLKQINELKSSMDSSSAALISNIQKQYESLITKQTDANTRNEASINQSLLMSGSSRYAGVSSAGIAHEIVSSGIDKISNIQQQETAAVIAAQQAQQDNDYKLLDKQLSIYENLRQEKAAATQKLAEELRVQNQKLQEQKDQSKKDTAVSSVLSSGITDPSQILKALREQGYTNISAKDISDTIANLTPEAKDVHDIMKTAASNGASPEIVKAIGQAKTVEDAIKAAGNSLQTATGTLGDYLQYKRDVTTKGLVPKDYQTYKDEQDAKALKAKVTEAYAVQNAKNLADANSTSSDKVQQKLEQQYRQVLAKEFSSRTGALGVENAKVNQANHLNSLFTQYYDPKTGNYNIPKTQYAELAIGLGNLVAPTGVVSEGARDAIMQKTAAGDLNGAIAYVTGIPQNGSSQDVFKNLIDSVDRQAETAARNRDAALQNMRDQAPTDLEQSRIDKLNKSTEMVKYEGSERISKSNVNNYIKANPKEAENVAKLYEVPGATDQDIEAYLKAQGKLK